MKPEPAEAKLKDTKTKRQKRQKDKKTKTKNIDSSLSKSKRFDVLYKLAFTLLPANLRITRNRGKALTMFSCKKIQKEFSLTGT